MSLKTYFQESFQELHQVSWPTRRQSVRITVIVAIFMAASAVLLGFADQLLAMGYKALLNLSIL